MGKWSAIPAKRSSAMPLKRKQSSIIGVICFMAILGPISFVISLTSSSTPPPAQNQSGPGFDPLIAKEVIFDYFENITIPSSISIASNLQNIYNDTNRTGKMNIQSIEFATTIPSQIGTSNINVYYFILKSNNTLYKVALDLEFVNNYYSIVSLPTLQPYNPQLPATVANDYSNFTSNNMSLATTDVKSAISNWAKAFINNDATGLQQAVNDQNTYVGLTGFSFAKDPEILSIFSNTAIVNTYYARVRLYMTPNSAKQLILPVDYDIMVAIDGKTLPHVVAWGSAGTLPFTPYQNRVTS